MRYTTRGLIVFLLAGALGSPAPADDLSTANGKKLTGKLTAVAADGVVFKVGETETKIPAKDIAVVDLGNKIVAPAAKAPYTELELTDGSVLRCSRFLVKGKKVEVELLPGPEKVSPPVFDLQMGSLFTAMRRADEPKNRDEFKRMLAARGKRDIYVMRAPDGLSMIQGTVIEGTAAGTGVVFEREDGKREEFLLSRATGGLVFSQPQPATIPPTVCKVLDVFGNTLFAQAVEMGASGIKVKTVCGVAVTYPDAAAVAKLDYSQGNVAYLSDLEPQVVPPEFPDDEKLRAAYLKDRTLANEALKLDNTIYARGLWVYTDTILTYTIGGDYREFRAVVGIDEGVVNNTAAAKLTIEGDGQVLFSEVIKRTEKPKVIVKDVKGVKELRVRVESDTVFNGNSVILAEARVLK
jgi:hypothetical protein